MTEYRQRTEGEHFAVTRYERDRYGRVLKLTNPNGNVVSYMYGHGFKEPTMTTLPEGETESTRQRTRTAAPT